MPSCNSAFYSCERIYLNHLIYNAKTRLLVKGGNYMRFLGSQIGPSRIACLLVLFGWPKGPAQAADAIVGSVKTVQGSAAVRRGADRIPIQEGMHLLLNDVLQTSGDGRLGVILQDGTRISLGPNSELAVDRFVYQPVEGNFALLLRFGRGVLAYVSGKIAHFSPSS